MKFKATVAVFGSIFGVLALGGCGTATQEQVVPAATSSEVPKVATTVHDNEILFQAGSGVRSVNFAYDGKYDITPGQPWEGVYVDWTGKKVQLDARAGRSSSASVATWYGDRVDHGATTAPRPSSSKPSDLDFAFTGRIVINGAEYNTTLGQGGTGVPDRGWYIGSNGWVPVTDKGNVGLDRVMTPDRQYTISAASNGDDTFWRVSQN